MIQAANDKERVVGQRTWGSKGQGRKQAPLLDVYIQIYFQTGKWTNEIVKPQVSINSNNSTIDCKNCNLK